MALLSPSLVRLEAPLVDSLQLMENLGCESVHIDVCHDLSLPNFFDLGEVRVARIENYSAATTLHVFRMISGASPNLGFLRPNKDLAILHVFPRTTPSTIEEFLRTNRTVGCRVGLAIDVQAETESIAPYLTDLDTVFVMAISAAAYGLEPDTQLLHRVEQTRTLIEAHNPHCRLGIDGGVNGRTFPRMVWLADELVVGSLLLHSNDLVSQWVDLQSIAKGGTERWRTT